MGLRETEIYVGTQRMKRDLAFHVQLGTGKFSSVQTACATNLDALRTAFHRGLDGTLHCTAERNTLRQLLRDRFADQLRVHFGTPHFLDLNQNFLVSDNLGEDVLDDVKALVLLGTRIALGAAFRRRGSCRSCGLAALLVVFIFVFWPFARHDNARTSRENRDTNTLRKALDHNLADGRTRQLFRQFIPYLQVLLQQRPELGLAREPAGFPVFCHWKTKPNRIYFLTHVDAPASYASSVTTLRMWLVRFLI